MTSRRVHTWKVVKNERGDMERTTRLRLAPRGCMDLGAFDLETCAEAARQSCQRLLASTAACKKQWIIASLDINITFLQGLTYQELAEATGDTARVVRSALPPGSASALRSLPGFEHYDESKHCLQRLKPGTGTMDAPRVSPLKLSKTTGGLGLRPTSRDEDFETNGGLLTGKHVDDINMASAEDTVDKCVKCVEYMFDTPKMGTVTAH
eukprot:2361636-Pyramimonas_sp.AAC.1